MEPFYKTIKRELIQGAKFKTPEQARKEIFKYIELYYNTKECILLWMIFFLLNLRKSIHNIHLA
ncbi:TPA: IS3 family transposase [Bacillus cereus]|nr:IS3 family transposase [Bacillus cereus]HDR4915011.1 IS3 family transposase [Bacillus cereus]